MAYTKQFAEEKNKQYLTYQINDTVFYIIDVMDYYPIFARKTSPGIDDSLSAESLSSIHNIKSGLLVLDNKFAAFQLNDIRNEMRHAIFEMCYIKPDKTTQTEENWLKWVQLHDSLQTGYNYIIYSGTIGFDNPFYMCLSFASDSITMKKISSKLWNEGKEKANKLFKQELGFYRKYENYNGTLIPELSYWPG